MNKKILLIVLCSIFIIGCKKQNQMKSLQNIKENNNNETENKTEKIFANELILKKSDKEVIFPKMVTVQEGNLNIQISETLITFKEYDIYLKEKGNSHSEDFSRRMKQKIDNNKYEFISEIPIWGTSWIESIEYCNWLSLKQNLEPYYELKKLSNKTITVTINRFSNGYRLPYVRELLILSGKMNGLTQTQYELENLHGVENDINYFNVKPVYEGKKNKYGIYDLLGNLPQYCNDYYNEDYNYYDYSLSEYGPEEYTPDEDQVFFNEPLTAMRCYLGGFFCSTYEDIQKKLIWEVNEISSDIVGIRVVKNLS